MAQSCPECDGQVETIPDTGEQYCRDCGLVVEEICIDHGPDWRAYDADEFDDGARAGAPETGLMHDKGLSTVIGWKDEDAHGNSLSAPKRQRLQRLRTWDERTRTKTSQERILKQALAELQRMASCLDVGTAVRESTSQVFRDTLDDGLTQGHGYEAVVSAALYAACRLDHVPRTLEGVADTARVDKESVKSAYQLLSKELELAVEPPRPHTFVAQIADSLGVETETEMLAIEFLKTYQEEDLHVGRRPKGLAGAALYAANLVRGTPEHLTEDAAADGADVAASTIRKRHREILEANSEDPKLAHPGHHKEQSSWDRFASDA